jgi:hypothetical protein
MASTVTNKTAKNAADRFIAGQTYKLILLTGNTTSWKTAATARDFDFVAAIVADEPVHASYARPTVVVTATEDDTNDWAKLAHADATFSALDPAVGAAEGYAVMEMGTTDADSPIVGLIDLSIDIPLADDRTPDGNDFIVRCPANGFTRFKTA